MRDREKQSNQKAHKVAKFFSALSGRKEKEALQAGAKEEDDNNIKKKKTRELPFQPWNLQIP